MATRGQDIISLIKRQIEEFGGDLALVDVGTVVQVGDGVASIQGLQGVPNALGKRRVRPYHQLRRGTDSTRSCANNQGR